MPSTIDEMPTPVAAPVSTQEPKSSYRMGHVCTIITTLGGVFLVTRIPRFAAVFATQYGGQPLPHLTHRVVHHVPLLLALAIGYVVAAVVLALRSRFGQPPRGVQAILLIVAVAQALIILIALFPPMGSEVTTE
jgi:hypothetical protein